MVGGRGSMVFSGVEGLEVLPLRLKLIDKRISRAATFSSSMEIHCSTSSWKLTLFCRTSVPEAGEVRALARIGRGSEALEPSSDGGGICRLRASSETDLCRITSSRLGILKIPSGRSISRLESGSGVMPRSRHLVLGVCKGP